ncbi:MAG: hypothetical protein IJY71_00490 [Clostridia bacterium]|nr:hypothetical protein [Clostridia bacterium]
MKKGLLLYRAAEVHSEALEEINRALFQKVVAGRRKVFGDEGMLPFEAEEIKEKILAFLMKYGSRLHCVEVRYSLKSEMPYVYVEPEAQDLMPIWTFLKCLAAEYGLALYFPDRKRTFYTVDKRYKDYAYMRLRARELNELAQRTLHCVWRLRCLDVTEEENRRSCSYVISLDKEWGSFESNVRSFYKLLKESLNEKETLSTDCKCFTVRGEGYEIVYCVEGYRNHADRVGYIQKGRPLVTLMRRMCCELAAKQSKHFEPWELEDVKRRMRQPDWIEQYPNPAERYVESVNLTKRQRRDRRKAARCLSRQ